MDCREEKMQFEGGNWEEAVHCIKIKDIKGDLRTCFNTILSLLLSKANNYYILFARFQDSPP